MSFLIRGGYNPLNSIVTNIFLKKTNKWKSGMITTNHNLYLGQVEPDYDSIFDMIKIDETYLLTLNNRIIYENKTPIVYYLNLLSCSKEYNHGITDIDSFISVFNNTPYDKIKQ
jgi:hypothetical protein